MRPRYPIYIPSKGRSGMTSTTAMFEKFNVDYRIVVEPQDYDAYAERIDKSKIITLPDNNRGLVYARNFCKDHSINVMEAERHWQFDDDIKYMRRLHQGERVYIDAGLAIAIAEQFTDRYTNIALTSFNHVGFLPCGYGKTRTQWAPFVLNTRCYTVFLVNNALPNRWRFRYNEDTDMTLQVLADGWCTVMFNAMHMQTTPTNYGGTEKRGPRGGRISAGCDGGQQQVYAGDGRLKMARDLERVWPGVVRTKRRFGRPQHALNWSRFDTKLIRRTDIDWDAIEKGGANEFGMKLKAVSEIKSRVMQDYLKDNA